MVSQMYPAFILITSADTCIPNVSCMYLVLHQLRTSLDTFRVCISDCIPHVSRPASKNQDTYIVILYLGVSSCIVIKSPRYMYPDVS